MQNLNLLSDQLNKIDFLTKQSKLYRFVRFPFKLAFSFCYIHLIYPVIRVGFTKRVHTFFNRKIFIKFPSGADIFLFGTKTHPSEIHLARFLLKHLQPGDTFIDVGAHFGYYSLLAAMLVEKNGRVHAFEPSGSTFQILSKNVATQNNIVLNNRVVSNTNGYVNFYEFPLFYSENNTLHIQAFEKKSWFKKNKPKITKVKSTTLANYCSTNTINPTIIKIDVEGAEYEVISGMQSIFTERHPIIIMECWNEFNPKVIAILKNHGYKSYRIDEDGNLNGIHDLEGYFIKNNIISDNIVFQR